MVFFSVMMLFTLLVCGAMLLLWNILCSLESEKDKMSSLEAGFNSLSKSSKGSFSMQFFILMVIFISFDLEILMLFGIIFTKSLFVSFIIILFVIVTLWMEWLLGKLNWIIYMK